MPHRIPWIWPVFLALSALSGLYCLIVLTRLPSDGGAGLLGFSAARLALLAALGLAILALAGLAVGLARRPALRRAWDARARQGRVLLAGLALSVGLGIAPLSLIDLLRTLFRDSADFRYAAYAARLAPLCSWLALVGLLLLATLAAAYGRDILAGLGDERGALRRWGWIGLAFALLAVLAAWTRVGFSGDALGSWGLPDVPLLEWQIGLALLVSLLAALLLTRLRISHLDLALSLVIWAAAALLWAGHPLVPGYFATPGRAPNYEIYPFSDGQVYDQYAQSILVGNGLMGAIPQRPLYIVFLACLHALVGQDYLRVIFLQQLILAALPVLIYGIGKELHSRPAGVLAALLVILREVTAIRAAPFTDNISYSKLYFSELPTALCLSAFTLFALRWAQGWRQGAAPRWSLDALLAGGCLGAAMLIRTQSFAALPLVALAALWVMRRDWRGWLRGALLMAAGIGVVIVPWLARNYPLAGGFAFDNADSQTLVLAQRYNNLAFDAPIPRQPGEQEAHYSSRLVQMALVGMARDPSGAAWLVANHWMNNEISNVLIFPIRFSLSRPSELIWPESAFWQAWDGQLSLAQWLLVLANLGLLAAGLAGATARAGSLGWTPLLVALAYNLSTSIFRSSGGRFLVPVDWTVVLLYALGWGQVLFWGWSLAGLRIPAVWRGADGPRAPAARTRFSLPLPVRLCAASLAFLLVGLSLPLSERVFPRRYPPESQAVMASQLLSGLGQAGGQASARQFSAVQALSQQPGVVLLRGRALYPRYYQAGESEPKTAKVGYAGLPDARLVFYVAGSQNGLVVLPLDASPVDFPNASDVIVLGCAEAGYTRAAAVVVEGKTRPEAYLASGPVCGQ